MKKTLAILLAMVMLFALAVPVMAASSPAAGKKLTFVVVDAPDAKPEVVTVTVSEDINDGTMTQTIVAEAKHGDDAFATWSVYRRDGSAAVAGVDYKLVDSALTDLTVKIIPLTDLIAAADFGSEKTAIDDAKDAFQNKSDPTGDATVAALAVVMFVALAGTVVCKKQLAK